MAPSIVEQDARKILDQNGPTLWVTTTQAAALNLGRSLLGGQTKQPQETAGHRAVATAVPVQHTMVVGEGRFLIMSHDAERGGNGAAAGAQDRTGDQHQDMLPGGGGETMAERRHPSG